MTGDEQNAVERERLRTQLRDRARVFREIFGPWGQPTTHGQIILDALQAKFGTVSSLPPNILGDDGHTDPYQTWRRLGHFDVLEYIRTQLEWKENHVNSSG